MESCHGSRACSPSHRTDHPWNGQRRQTSRDSVCGRMHKGPCHRQSGNHLSSGRPGALPGQEAGPQRGDYRRIRNILVQSDVPEILLLTKLAKQPDSVWTDHLEALKKEPPFAVVRLYHISFPDPKITGQESFTSPSGGSIPLPTLVATAGVPQAYRDRTSRSGIHIDGKP